MLTVLAGCGGGGEARTMEAVRSVPDQRFALPAVTVPQSSAPLPAPPATKGHARARATSIPRRHRAPVPRPAGSGPALTTPIGAAPPPAAPAPKPARRPTGAPVVYSGSGDGPFTTPTFAITAKRWTVAYRNDGDFFQALVLAGGKPEPFVLNSVHRGSRTETLRGPGRFQLRISAGDRWLITVRDGA